MSKKNKNWKKNKLQVQRTETENGKTANPKKETIPAYNLTNRVRHYDKTIRKPIPLGMG